MVDKILIGVAIVVPAAMLIAAAVVVFVVFRRENALIASGAERMAEQKARIARASLAQATVVSSRTLSTHEDGSLAFVELRLEVQPPGRAAYHAKTEWEMNLSALPMVGPGAHVAVKIDSEDAELIYPNVSWAEMSRAYIARSVGERRMR